MIPSHRRSVFRLLAVFLAGACQAPGAAPEAQTEMSVQLPPFIVESTIGPTWRYTEIPRFEILSRCNDVTTERLALAFHRANQLLELVLPERFQLTLDVPQALIFYDEKLWPVAEQQAVAAMLQAHPPARPDGVPSPGAPPRVRLEPMTGAKLLAADADRPVAAGNAFFSNLMLTDADAIVTFALVSEATIDPQRSYLTSAYVSNLLQNRIPSLPDWFTAGFMRLYDRMEFADNTVTTRPLRWEMPQSPTAKAKSPPSELELRLPLGSFLGGDAPAADLGPWLEQAELLVAWGLDPAQGRAEAFWRWLDRLSREPATEALFRECISLDYTAATRSILAYSVNHRGLRWVLPEERSRPPSFPLEDATARQIARLKGEWERLEARYVRKNRPALEEQYTALARRTLRKPYDRGDRDPRLVASLGLLELEADDVAAAKALLEEAVAGGVVRPRVYYALARLRYDALFGRSTRNDGKYTTEQTDPILQPLLQATRQAPPLSAVYELMAHVYLNRVEPPTAEELEVLAQGTRYFSRNSGLVRQVAALQGAANKMRR
ncbi:hypothetical protein Verru16b_03474 [Lacunisphaera limnophila]|uniref:DUF3160 domain-containing protein n=1 Tax=Lacunisphaera limnophila TaxID=1838286 RepID=A0A1D8AZQ3_9BACT|nr:hypothetical protein [Lacunisphaera limnophila]AOS46370.1 hypothetical protein Verru16b_03474 [Lacunisphaera limnophila]